MDEKKVISKCLRLRLTSELKETIRSLPISDFQETQVGNHIYMGNGKVRIGTRKYPAEVRVWLHDGQILARLKSKKAGLEVVAPFETAAERKTFSYTVATEIARCMN